VRSVLLEREHEEVGEGQGFCIRRAHAHQAAYHSLSCMQVVQQQTGHPRKSPLAGRRAAEAAAKDWLKSPSPGLDQPSFRAGSPLPLPPPHATYGCHPGLHRLVSSTCVAPACYLPSICSAWKCVTLCVQFAVVRRLESFGEASMVFEFARAQAAKRARGLAHVLLCLEVRACTRVLHTCAERSRAFVQGGAYRVLLH